MLVDLLDEAVTTGQGRYRCLPDHDGPHDLADLWHQAADAARWFVRNVGLGGTAAAVLTSSPESLIVLAGALRAGVRLLSLPLPAPSDTIESYARYACWVCTENGAAHLLVDERYQRMAAALPLDVESFTACTATGCALPAGSEPTLVQFTSGSTSTPKGVVLADDAIARHLEALLTVIDPHAGETACSWLPLSHDMGLFGLTLAPWVAASARWAGRGQLVLIDSLAYARDPALWMRACARYGATITAAPPRAYRSAARQLELDHSLRLDDLRIAIAGAEPLPPDWLRAFDVAAQSRGARPTCLCPGYGLAEATLAVTMVDPAETWHTTTVHRAGGGPVELVGVGHPVPGTEVRAGRLGRDGSGEPGIIGFRSPHGFTGYTGTETASGVDAVRWHDTRDLGVLDDTGELSVIGRVDDVIIVNGHNVHPEDIEVALLCEFAALDLVAAVPSPASGIDILLELGTDDAGAAGHPDARQIRRSVRNAVGAGVHRILRTRRGTLPRTPSGKVRRHEARRLLDEGTLDVAEL